MTEATYDGIYAPLMGNGGLPPFRAPPFCERHVVDAIFLQLQQCLLYGRREPLALASQDRYFVVPRALK